MAGEGFGFRISRPAGTPGILEIRFSKKSLHKKTSPEREVFIVFQL
jgi:hypothetical protein